ncbi:TPA: Gfo/Idh/MocA family oxidoreductase, partial [Candidatus Poribacteria bacterium]|nr:Gfo/Idh/MocA family oxidoreductase [Candidatus Poribacteria bacterium]
GTGLDLAQKCNARFVPNWQEMVQQEDLDGIVVCTANDSHGEIVIASLEHDKHVFTEYPLARSLEEGKIAAAIAISKQKVLRVSHSEPVLETHQAIRQEIEHLGQLLVASFLRLTPGRGGRPEVLFNLRVSGPPAHFFIYHIYPVVDLFGQAKWVEANAIYNDLTDSEGYDQFVNTVTVGFKDGGIGHWTWAGGIEIQSAEQHHRYVLDGGTLVNSGEGWQVSTRSGIESITPISVQHSSVVDLWLSEVLDNNLAAAQIDTAKALDAIHISLLAEKAMQKNRRVPILF